MPTATARGAKARPASHIARDFGLIAAPGSGFAYSETGYTLLKLVLEVCTGEDFAVFMAREVLAPLGTPTASFDWTGAPMSSNPPPAIGRRRPCLMIEGRTGEPGHQLGQDASARAHALVSD